MEADGLILQFQVYANRDLCIGLETQRLAKLHGEIF
jgi:hypothetical protein